MKQNLIAFLIIGLILISSGVIYLLSKSDDDYTDGLNVVKTWELPFVLREVSGISHVDDTKIACIQDEDGIIFIYDLELKRITKEIEFGPKGDYESIRIIDSTAFIMESNGNIYKIIDFKSDTRKIETYKTEFNSSNDMESLDFHSGTNTFLTIPKENNLTENGDDLIIYKLNPEDFTIGKELFFSLSYDDSIVKVEKLKFIKSGFSASELTIHPQTGEIFLLDSKFHRLLILNSDGSPKKLFMLDPENFQQPEGLSFDSLGKMYISNEESDFLKQNIQLVEWK